MDMVQVMLRLSENNVERVKVDPRIQLAALYRETREILGRITALEKRLGQFAQMQKESRGEMDRLISRMPQWRIDIEDAKERLVHQQGLTLKDMLGIQQEAMRLEDEACAAETKIGALRSEQEQYDAHSKKILARLQELKAQYNQYAGVYNQEKAETQVILARFSSRENELLAQLKPEDTATYRDALKKNPDSPVATLEGEICSGCRIGISKQTIKQVAQVRRAVLCENCLRILLPEQALRLQPEDNSA